MALVNVDIIAANSNWSEFQVDWFGPKVSEHQALFHIHQNMWMQCQNLWISQSLMDSCRHQTMRLVPKAAIKVHLKACVNNDHLSVSGYSDDIAISLYRDIVVDFVTIS